jgi:RND family efflux transporter MFP subunit
MLPRLLITLLALPGLAGAADYTGLVHARHQLTLSVASAGVVAGVPVQPGRRVQAGQLLLQLDDRLQAIEEQRRKLILDDQSELRAIDERLKIVLPLAEDARKLQGGKGALSREDAARTELDLVSTRGRLLQLQAQEERERAEHQGAVQERAQRRLLAPVAGVITRVAIDVGEWARPGDPLVELVDASVLHLRVNVPAAAARGLKEGAALAVSFEPALQLPAVQGQLSFVSPVVDAASGLVELRVQFPNPGGRIPPGIKGQVQL